MYVFAALNIQNVRLSQGNHHLLSERQRLALARITSPRAALEERERKRLREAPENWKVIYAMQYMTEQELDFKSRSQSLLPRYSKMC